MVISMTVARFKKILPKICGKDTSFDHKGWTKDNPLWGHCTVVSLLAQSLFGGEILYVSLKGTKFAKMKLHFWNALLDDAHLNGTQKDFTRVQYGKEYPKDLEIKIAEISDLLANKNTARRLKLLQERFEVECQKK